MPDGAETCVGGATLVAVDSIIYIFVLSLFLFGNTPMEAAWLGVRSVSYLWLLLAQSV